MNCTKALPQFMFYEDSLIMFEQTVLKQENL